MLKVSTWAWCRHISAVTVLESRPPLRKAPSGTSLTSRLATQSSSSPENCSAAAPLLTPAAARTRQRSAKSQ